MPVNPDLIQAMARDLLGRDPLEPELLAETARRLNDVIARVRAADERTLGAVAPAFHFDPADPAYTAAPPHKPPVWADMATGEGGTGYGGAGTTGVKKPPPTSDRRAAAGPKAPEFLWWDAADLAAAVRQGQLSPVEVVRAALEQIEASQPYLNAFVTITAEAALARAHELERAARRGEIIGPLHGVPVAVKDMIETAGVPTTAGSQVLSGYIPKADATCVQRLQAAGAIILGKTATHEFAFGPTTDSPFFGPTRNPWHPDHVPAGSSGGSAAAVAAGLVPIALGTDTGGSIRMPAAACGVFGLKPTYGRVSKAGALPLSWSLDHIGPITRTVRDAAITLGVLAGPDPRDPTALPVPVPAEWEPPVAGGHSLRGTRVGIPVAWLQHIDPDVMRRFQAAAGVLKHLEAEIVEVYPPPADVITFVNRLITLGEVSAHHAPLLARRAADYSPDVRARVELGQFIMARDYLTAQRLRGELSRQMAQVMADIDVLITPAMPIPAPLIGQSTWTFGKRREAVQESMIRFAAPFSVTGQPAVSIPCGLTDQSGLPVGLQIVGKPLAEAYVMTVAAVYAAEVTGTDADCGRPPAYAAN